MKITCEVKRTGEPVNCILGTVTTSLSEVVGAQGLEPAAFRVTGGRYNQLNYHSVKMNTCE